jgi:AraC-like DNA-binding protein
MRSDGYGTDVPGLHVARITCPIPPTAHLADASVCVCIRSSRQLKVGGSVYTQAEDQYLLNALSVPTIIAIEEASVDNPYIALRVDLDLDLARQVMAEIDVGGGDIAPTNPRPSFGAVDHDFLDAVARLVRLIEAPQDKHFLSGLIHREILYRLLSGPNGLKLRQIVRLGSQGNRVAKAVTWLRTHFQERLKIEQLAAVAGMGVSTLHRHFHELTGMSPIQYQKQLRLHDARRQMLENDLDVGSAALAVGYESSTQFIREYRRLFGEPPLRDVKTLRLQGRSRDVL